MPKTETFARTVPCKSCPFRKDVPIYVRAGRRAEIVRSLQKGGIFPCHQTIEYTDEEDETGETIVDTSDGQFCAGALKAMAQSEQMNQMGRIMIRLGQINIAAVEQSEVEVWDLQEWPRLADGATGDDPIEEEEHSGDTCGVVGGSCEAPAGYMINGMVVEGTEFVDAECPACGVPCCDSCFTPNGLCLYCDEEE